MRKSYGLLLLGCSLALAACDGSREDEARPGAEIDSAIHREDGHLQCDDLQRLASARFESPPSALTQCATDDDCTVISSTFVCEDKHVKVVGCGGLPVAVGSEDAGRLFRESVEAELCPRATSNCAITPSCVPATSRCISGRCTQTTDYGDVGVAPNASLCGPDREMAYGYRVDEQRGCLADREPVGCRDVPTACAEAIAVVRDVQGRLFWFGNLCLPDDVEVVGDAPSVNWDLCNPPPREPFRSCEGLSTSLCASEPDCAPITGIQYDPAQACRAGFVATLGCRQKTDACDEGLHYVRFADTLFQVPDGCIPSKSVAIAAPPRPVDDWKVCTSFR